MLTIAELEKETAQIFDGPILTPEPSPHFKRKIEALQEACLPSHAESCIFDMRCDQAERAGFKRVSEDDLVVMLMGEPHSHVESIDQRQDHEWFYNHQTQETLQGEDCKWGGSPTDFVRTSRPSWIRVSEEWRCRFGKLDYLKREIPYGVVLRIQEIKKLNLFNGFNVLAPIEAWRETTNIDPILVASIWSIKKEGQTQHADQSAQ